MKNTALALALGLLSVLVACHSYDEKGNPCNEECGKLISSYHYRELQEINLIYISECTQDTVSYILELNEEQLGDDNGISYYVDTFDVGQYYCEGLDY